MKPKGTGREGGKLRVRACCNVWSGCLPMRREEAALVACYEFLAASQ